MSFSHLIKGTTPENVYVAFCPNNQHLFEPFMSLDLTLQARSISFSQAFRVSSSVATAFLYWLSAHNTKATLERKEKLFSTQYAASARHTNQTLTNLLTTQTPEEKLFIHIIQIQQHKEKQEKLFIHSICKNTKERQENKLLHRQATQRKTGQKQKQFYEYLQTTQRETGKIFLYRLFPETGKLTFYTEYLQAKQDRKKLFILKKTRCIFAIMIAHRTNKTLKCHLACLSVIFVRPRLHQWAEFFLYPGDMLLLCIYL